MRTSETRLLNQCTYTPIDPTADNRPGNGDSLKKPFIKQEILASVFDDYKLARMVLEHLRRLSKDEVKPDSPEVYQKLADAVSNVWAGRVKSSIGILRDVSADEVARFAKKALDIEGSLLDQTQKDVMKATQAVQSEIKKGAKGKQAKGLPKGPAPMSARATSPQATKPGSASEDPARTAEMIEARLTRYYRESSEVLNAVRGSSAERSTPKSVSQTQVFDVRRNHIDKARLKVQAFLEDMKVEPVGYLHLERLQFTPLGYERGELVYSLPLTPQETVRLTHREWSRTEQEYSKLVAAQLETATEEALSEKSELTQSTTTQQQHSTAMNTSVNASGGWGPVHISASFGYNVNNSESQTRQTTAHRSQEITRKASSRAKEEHKINFRVASTYEVTDESYREIKNPRDQAVRYDFHRMMLKWRIDLYRYDVRLTYDIVIPEPASYLLRKYVLLRQIENDLAKPFSFTLDPASIEGNWEALEIQYETYLDPPPKPAKQYPLPQDVAFSKLKGNICTSFFQIDAPDGYYISDLSPVLNGLNDNWINGFGQILAQTAKNKQRLQSGHQFQPEGFGWQYQEQWNHDPLPTEGSTIRMQFDVTATVKPELRFAWQTQCFQRLADAAKAQYEANRQRLTAIRDALLDELNQEDALSLRKLEHEEVMKGVLRWLLGPTFRFYPQDKLKLPDLPPHLGNLDSSHDLNSESLEDTALAYYDPITQGVKDADVYAASLHFGEMIKFLHQAIEWENMNYILYPYFWTEPDKDRWDFKQSLYHSDYEHRAFLRAGAARVVLPVRRGFEEDLLGFMEGEFDELLSEADPTHPYVTAAQELKAMAETSYPYTEDANMDKEAYFFTWENVAGGAEDDWFLNHLNQDFYVAWAEKNGTSTITITKSEDQKTIQVARTENTAPNIVVGSVSITLDNTRPGVAVLKITDGKAYDLVVKHEENKLKIYRQQNLVDIWYEFTPTGAMDIVEGAVLNE